MRTATSPRRATDPESTGHRLPGSKGDTEEKLLLTVAEAAHRLGVGRTMMYELLDAGVVKSIHIGRLHKIPVWALSEFVESQCEM
ncbi:helix-turn-helix domain-containing protein [Actinotalea sp.]|uniref:helix-turn-helix domain-containing protein n=1 Tax=Actinotalea sp. TaxID=1872145 RepID=UPI003562373E